MTLPSIFPPIPSQWVAYWWTKGLLSAGLQDCGSFKGGVVRQRTFSDQPWQWWNTSGKSRSGSCTVVRVLTETMSLCVSLYLYGSSFLKVKQWTETHLMSDALNLHVWWKHGCPEQFAICCNVCLRRVWLPSSFKEESVRHFIPNYFRDLSILFPADALWHKSTGRVQTYATIAVPPHIFKSALHYFHNKLIF